MTKMSKEHHWTKQVVRFLVVGLTAAIVDWSTYRSVLWLTSIIPFSKGCGFVLGTIYAYVANRFWTFGEHTHHGLDHVYRFIFVYLSTLALNVAVNSYLLSLMNSFEWRLGFAFIGATLVSSFLNFLGMKFYVFKKQVIK